MRRPTTSYQDTGSACAEAGRERCATCAKEYDVVSVTIYRITWPLEASAAGQVPCWLPASSWEPTTTLTYEEPLMA